MRGPSCPYQYESFCLPEPGSSGPPWRPGLYRSRSIRGISQYYAHGIVFISSNAGWMLFLTPTHSGKSVLPSQSTTQPLVRRSPRLVLHRYQYTARIIVLDICPRPLARDTCKIYINSAAMEARTMPMYICIGICSKSAANSLHGPAISHRFYTSMPVPCWPIRFKVDAFPTFSRAPQFAYY